MPTVERSKVRRFLIFIGESISHELQECTARLFRRVALTILPERRGRPCHGIAQERHERGATLALEVVWRKPSAECDRPAKCRTTAPPQRLGEVRRSA